MPDSLVCAMIAEQLKKTGQNLDGLGEYDCQYVPNILNSSIALTKGVVTYWPLSYGHGETYVDVILPYDRLLQKFAEAFEPVAGHK